MPNGVNESTLPYLTGKQKVTDGKGVVAKIASHICTRFSLKKPPRMLHEVAHVSNACRHKILTAKL